MDNKEACSNVYKKKHGTISLLSEASDFSLDGTKRLILTPQLH